MKCIKVEDCCYVNWFTLGFSQIPRRNEFPARLKEDVTIREDEK